MPTHVIDDRMLTRLLRDECRALRWPFFEDGEYDLNYFGVRGPERIADQFDDVLGCATRVGNQEMVWLWRGTTDPGKPHLAQPLRVEGCAILVPGFYPGLWTLGEHNRGKPGAYEALVQVGQARVWRDDNRDQILDMDGPTTTNVSGLNMHKAGKDSKLVGAWSATCQVHQKEETHKVAMTLAHAQKDRRGWNTYGYKLFDVVQSPRLQVLLQAVGAL